MSQARRPTVVLGAPSNLGLRPPRAGHEPGVRGMAEALRAAGIVDRLGAIDAGDVAPSAYDPTWEPGTGTRNVAAIADHAVALADGLDTIFAKGSFPVVLGGDCSILLGSMLAGGRLGADLLRSGAGPGWLARPPAGAGHRDRLFDTPA